MNILIYIAAGAAVLGAFASLVLGRFIGVEMMTVFQIAFIGLMVMENIEPLLAPFAHISFVNGFDDYYNIRRNSLLHSGDVTPGELPYRMTGIGY